MDISLNFAVLNLIEGVATFVGGGGVPSREDESRPTAAVKFDGVNDGAALVRAKYIRPSVSGTMVLRQCPG